MGVLTVGVVTKPFQFEGSRRMRQAEEGVEDLQRVVDTLIVIPNQNLFRLANEKTTFTEAFSMADDVLYQGVKGVTDLMVRPGIINLDFADIRSVMDEMGKAMMGTGEAEGEDRAVQAAEKAIANPLLDEISLKGARGVLINVTGGDDLTLFELDEAANRIRGEVDADANIIVGSTLDPSMDGRMRVSVVATGIDVAEAENAPPRTHRVEVAAPVRRPESQPEPVVEAEPELPMNQPAFVDSRADEPQGDVHHEPLPPAARTEPERAPQVALTASRDEWPAVEPQPAPRKPGEPSPEALRRLQAAVNKVPDAPAPRAAAPRSAPVEDGGRFAINSLIHRMTGQSSRDDAGAADRQAPPMRARDHAADAQDGPREVSDIPAFLRRQAN